MKPMHATARAAALAAALAMPLLAACDRRGVEDDTTATPAEDTASRETGTPPPATEVSPPVATNTPEPPDAGETTPAQASVSQADALALLVALNEHEIAAAEQALGKNVTGRVREYADMMKADHSRNLTDTTKLGAAASTAPAVTQLKEKGAAELRALGGKAGKDYERGYIDAMVQGHTDALELIDGTLLPAATEARVRDHFTATRAKVAQHLEQAKQIQAELG